jgi:osmotically-inducible protein OsmY
LENIIMRIDRKRLVLGVAIAGALSLLIAGCGKNPEEQAAQPATTSQAPTTPESATTTEASGAAQPASTARAADQTSTAEAEDTAKPATTSVGTTIDDSVITAKVKAALLADPDIKSFDIAVETHKGEVQLSGFVDNQKQIDQAIEIAKNVDGVTNVGNAMSIKK